MAKKYNPLVKFGFDEIGTGSTPAPGESTDYIVTWNLGDNKPALTGFNTICGVLVEGYSHLISTKIVGEQTIGVIQVLNSANYFDTKYEDVANCIEVDDAGNIYVGFFSAPYLRKYDLYGNVDLGFTVPEIDGAVYDILINNDLLLIVGGFSGNVKRISLTGEVDNTFTSPALNGAVVRVILDNSNNILISGYFTGGIKRLLPNGSVDGSFIPSGLSNVVLIYDMALLGSDILVGGNFTGFLKKMNSSGTVDSSFNPTLSNIVRKIAVNTMNRIIVGTDTVGSILCFNSTGTLYSSFNQTISLPKNINGFFIDDMLDIVVVGDFEGSIKKFNYKGNAITTWGKLASFNIFDLKYKSGYFYLVGEDTPNQVLKVNATDGAIYPIISGDYEHDRITVIEKYS